MEQKQAINNQLQNKGKDSHGGYKEHNHAPGKGEVKFVCDPGRSPGVALKI
jgi:hypothetical protein